MVSDQQLELFLKQARIATHREVQKGRTAIGAHAFTVVHADEGLVYHRTQFGHKIFAGHEIVLTGDGSRPVWRATYEGSLSAVDDPALLERVRACLRHALKHQLESGARLTSAWTLTEGDLRLTHDARAASSLHAFEATDVIHPVKTGPVATAVYTCRYKGGRIA